MNCKLCKSAAISVLRDGPIRAGAFASKARTEKSVKIYQCSNCQVRFLEDFVDPDFYVSSNYREKFNGAESVTGRPGRHDAEKNELIPLVGIENMRGKSIADFGCGAGEWLDAAYGLARETYAIEPDKQYHPYLEQKHQVFSFGSDFVKTGTQVDLAFSLSVIEHLDDPVGHVNELYDSLQPGGRAYIKTPNFYDIAGAVADESFLDYFIRISHSWYFCAASLQEVFRQSKFSCYETHYSHKYDLSNLLLWAKEQRPSGMKHLDMFTDGFNKFYKSYIEEKGLASHLWIIATKN